MKLLTTWYLEMSDPENMRAKAGPRGFAVSVVAEPTPDLNRSLYRKVGGDWQWTGRLNWSAADWKAYVERDALTTGIVTMNGRPAGYFELETREEGEVEIVQLGLLPEYLGQGLGGALVTAALECAWAVPGARRVWLHTCTRDHPWALENYQRRGLQVFKTVEESVGTENLD